MGILDALPYEILVQIISELPWKDILRVRTVSKAFKAAFETSVHLQYLVELGAAGLVSNTTLRYPQSSSDGLASLFTWRESWRYVEWHAVDTIELDGAATFCDMIDGVFVLGTKSKGRHMSNNEFDTIDVLDTKSEDRICPSWTLELDVALVHVVFDPAQDLLVGIQNDVTATPTSTANHAPYKMHILSFSSGFPHPDAPQHVIPVADYRVRRAESIKTEILDDLVAVNVCSERNSLIGDRYTIFNWRTGIVQLQYQSKANNHAAFRLLSSGLILEAASMWHSFAEPPEITLALRTFVLQTTPHRVSAPFHPHTLALFYLPRLAQSAALDRLHFHATNAVSQRRCAPFAMQPFTPAPGPENCVLALDVTLHNQRMGCRPTTQTMFFLPGPLMRMAMVAGARIGNEYQWDKWGPQHTRWLNACLGPPMQGPGHGVVGTPRWLVGFRALSHKNGRIYDFNPRPLARDPDDCGDVVNHTSQLPANHLFAKMVLSSLPYRECVCQRTWPYQAMALDEHIIGVKAVTPPGVPRRQEIESIHVLLMMPDTVQLEPTPDETDDGMDE